MSTWKDLEAKRTAHRKIVGYRAAMGLCLNCGGPKRSGRCLPCYEQKRGYVASRRESVRCIRCHSASTTATCRSCRAKRLGKLTEGLRVRAHSQGVRGGMLLAGYVR